MNRNIQLDLGSVQETLLLPLWGRAVETQKKKPFLKDDTALAIIKNIPYDFTAISKNVGALSRESWIARSIYFDEKIKSFLETFPEAVIVNIGCGLDTTFDRVDNGRVRWFDLDLPDSIDLRRKHIPETERRRFIPKSVFDKSWFKEIKNRSHVMFMIAGVLYYFEEKSIKDLFLEFHANFPGVEIIFDYTSVKGVIMANRQVIKRSGMNKSSNLIWGIDDIYELEKWKGNISIISGMPMFREHKKHFPFFQRIGMTISDMMRIMSLAHIRIG